MMPSDDQIGINWGSNDSSKRKIATQVSTLKVKVRHCVANFRFGGRKLTDIKSVSDMMYLLFYVSNYRLYLIATLHLFAHAIYLFLYLTFVCTRSHPMWNCSITSMIYLLWWHILANYPSFLFDSYFYLSLCDINRSLSYIYHSLYLLFVIARLSILVMSNYISSDACNYLPEDNLRIVR